MSVFDSTQLLLDRAISGATLRNSVLASNELAEAALCRADVADLDGLTEVLARSEEIVATLPDHAPRSARSALERADAAHQRLGPALRASLAATRTELDLVGRA